MYEELGHRLKEFRKENKISQLDLAEALNTKQSSISKIENGKLLPTIENMKDLNIKYKLDLNWLITGQKTLENKTGESIIPQAPPSTAPDSNEIIRLLNEQITILKNHLEDKERYIQSLERELGLNAQTGS